MAEELINRTKDRKEMTNMENGIPFEVTAKKNTYGRLSAFANADLVAEEKGAYGRAMVEKHEKID